MGRKEFAVKGDVELERDWGSLGRLDVVGITVC